MSLWFRWYAGSCEDGKFRMVARNADVTVATVMGIWAVLLEDASHVDHRGLAMKGEPFYAAILDLAENEVVKILGAMEDAELVSVGHGAITVTKWKERQFETDASDPTNANRQRRWRDKRKSNTTDTERNATVTETKRPEYREQNTDSEKKETDSRSVAVATRPGRDQIFEEFWGSYPKREGSNPKAPARKSFIALVKSGIDPQAIIAGVRACAAKDRDKIGTPYIPQAVKWLRDRRWEDYQATAPPNETPAHLRPPPGMPSLEELRAKDREKLNGAAKGTEVRSGPGLGKNGTDRPAEL